ncbi:VCBS repeat domain-containing M23 family metallopeptidase [Microbacterium abyssi]|uniref:VCBS repeat domain-containing M23 family metallopeptidase n=1 Tax=Microbacterium abyssi TaxID=2782166 RepID=UPI0018893724|nr:VCBS repeat domain-containing M23 family metallopeptidase [Microbacterium sp. A18JL241]
MKRTSRWHLAHLAMLAAILLLVGVISPSLIPGEPAAAATNGQMVYPASGSIESKVGDGCRSNHRDHDGVDISGQGGTPILAAYDGVIKTRASNSGYGYYVDIQHAAGYVTRYAHMAAQASVAPGARVARGQQIGVVGNTGASTGAHLHFEVWRNGSVYTAINQGFVCLSKVTRGNPIPLVFPGLSTSPLSPVTSADYNGDGRADLLAVAGDSDLQFLAGNGKGGFLKASIVTGAWGIHRHLTHTDLNADGRADMLVARSDGVLEYYAGNTTGGFGAYGTPGSGWYDLQHVTSGADYTGDGIQDVLGVSAAGVLKIYRGDGTGALPGPHTVVGSGWNTIRYIVGGDFNGDRLGDLMAVADNGTLYFYPGLGGRFGTRVSLGSGWGAITALTGGVDYNGDKHPDLIARTTAGELHLYPGDGTGRLKSRILIGSGWGGYLQLE